MIGIFDSGVGGLTVVRAMKEIEPNLPIVYFGDTARVPWGEKSPETIREYSFQICNFLLSKKVNKIVIACNTASSVAGDYLRGKFPTIEIIDVVEPTINKIKDLKSSRKLRKIAVIGTKTVVASRFYEKKVKESFGDNIEVREIACPLFVPIVEEGWHEESFAEDVAKKYLKDICDWEPEVLILGCTHYPLLETTIKKIVGDRMQIINSASPIASYFKNSDNLNKKNIDQFYFSDLSPHYEKLIDMILGNIVDSKQVSL